MSEPRQPCRLPGNMTVGVQCFSYSENRECLLPGCLIAGHLAIRLLRCRAALRIGLLAATGRYDAALASRFLGVSESGFANGRLAEYLGDDQKARIDEVAAEVHGACARIEQMCGPAEAADPFAFLLDLKRAPLLAY